MPNFKNFEAKGVVDFLLKNKYIVFPLLTGLGLIGKQSWLTTTGILGGLASFALDGGVASASEVKKNLPETEKPKEKFVNGENDPLMDFPVEIGKIRDINMNIEGKQFSGRAIESPYINQQYNHKTLKSNPTVKNQNQTISLEASCGATTAMVMDMILNMRGQQLNSWSEIEDYRQKHIYDIFAKTSKGSFSTNYNTEIQRYVNGSQKQKYKLEYEFRDTPANRQAVKDSVKNGIPWGISFGHKFYAPNTQGTHIAPVVGWVESPDGEFRLLINDSSRDYSMNAESFVTKNGQKKFSGQYAAYNLFTHKGDGTPMNNNAKTTKNSTSTNFLWVMRPV